MYKEVAAFGLFNIPKARLNLTKVDEQNLKRIILGVSHLELPFWWHHAAAQHQLLQGVVEHISRLSL